MPLRLTVAALLLLAPLAAADPPRLKVSDNKRFLVTADGKPFFYLADTAWELFHRLDREQAGRYLRDRANKGFTVVQAVALAELDGLRDPNPYGQTPLTDDDPLRPNERYFEHVDWVVKAAGEAGLVVALLPTWGDKWNTKGKPPVFTPANARGYGEWLGRRYKDAPIIWVLGGDRAVETDAHKDVIRAMAAGLKAGDGGKHLMTFHPRGGAGSAEAFHADDWLDFNMRQNGHQPEFTGRYDKLRPDYDRTPAKPVLDGEPVYEDHPVSFMAKELGYSVAADCRRALYWNLFTGACGHTFGHHSVWQMFDKGRKPVNNPLMTWAEALDQPGAGQMRHGRRLMESRPFLSRVPDDGVVVPDPVATAVPGAGTRRFAATRDADGGYAMVYAPVGRPFTVRAGAVAGPTARAWWFNPRDGSATPAGDHPAGESKRFSPPTPGELLDWVLVVDAAGRNFPPPGR